MALAPITPRDRLQRLVDLGRKAARYWWLVAVFGVIGAVLSLGFALTRGHRYESSAVLFYQERIQSNILSNRQEEAQRNLGDRFRELLLARAQLSQITNDPKLNPYEGMDPDLAVDRLRTAVRFESRGGNNFRITFGDADPDKAKSVTDKLTHLLQDKDEALRNDQAQMTVQFVTQQKEEAAVELRKREQALAEFLAKHSEFAQDQMSGEGAGIRAIRNTPKTPVNTGNPRLYALERQRQRIQARLDAPPDQPVVRLPAPPTPERLAADAQVNDAQRELAAANRELEDALGKYTDKHPTVIKAQERVEAAQQRLRHAQAAVPPDDTTPLPPATPADRTKLQKELTQIEGQIADEQKSSQPKPVAQGSGVGSGSAAPVVDSGTNWVVELETKYADLRRQLNEQRERVGSLADSVFRAQMDASQKSAEQGGRLSVVDPAYKPVRPSGPGKTVFLLAGMVLFIALGATIAIGLAILDDRLYRRDDIDALDIPVLAVIPPIAVIHHQKKSA